MFNEALAEVNRFVESGEEPFIPEDPYENPEDDLWEDTNPSITVEEAIEYFKSGSKSWFEDCTAFENDKNQLEIVNGAGQSARLDIKDNSVEVSGVEAIAQSLGKEEEVLGSGKGKEEERKKSERSERSEGV